jgi:DNA-binding GntR family transcriptional regulator
MNDLRETSTLSQSAYAQLRQMILGGVLPAGTRLQEQGLAEQLGVSRTPVREAIGRLAAEGLVTRPGGGGAPVVHKISVGEIMEILHVRRLLECEAARQAAQGQPPVEQFLALRARIERFLQGERPSAEAHLEVDERLHDLIAAASGSQLLRALVGSLKVKTRMFDKGSIPERFEPGCHEHIAIIDAILARDPARAEMLMRGHLENARAAILAHLSRLF